MTNDLHVAAWTLIVGSVLFLVGAGLAPEPSKTFTGDLATYLDAIRHRYQLDEALGDLRRVLDDERVHELLGITARIVIERPDGSLVCPLARGGSVRVGRSFEKRHVRR